MGLTMAGIFFTRNRAVMCISSVATPFFYVDESLLIENLKLLRSVSDRSGCKILLAQKAFSMYSLYPLIGKYLHGTTASGLYEAILGSKEMGGQTHIYSPAFSENDIDRILEICDHVVFNSFDQWRRFRKKAALAERSYGIRINPECPTGSHAIYDPCRPGSRLGVTVKNFRPDLLEGISGLHFHTLCEQNADALIYTVRSVEEKFGKWLYDMKWLNIGGGHLITGADYDIDSLVNCITDLRDKYNLEVFMEPGAAVVLNTGFLLSSVLDIVDSGIANAILDTSAACHMPDVLEMPYRPEIIGAGKPGQKPHTYRLGGPTCLAGDIIGDYSFDTPLQCGDRLVFCDMAHYSMVKTNTFNGMPLPSIAIKKLTGELEVVNKFGYNDFQGRL